MQQPSLPVGAGQAPEDEAVGALTRRILELEGIVARQERDLSRSRNRDLEAAVRFFRSRGLILLNTGKGPAQLKAEISREYGEDAADRILEHVYDLNAAPVSPLTIDDLREACHGGLACWPPGRS